MSVRLEVSRQVAASPAAVWDLLVDWPGQGRWVPLTTVATTTTQQTGLGVRVAALSGFWVGRVPIGLLDRFVVTGWSPPPDTIAGAEGEAAEVEAELEILHLGPYFTGEGVFHLRAQDGGTLVECTELFTTPVGSLADAPLRLLLPLMRLGFARSLASFAALAESSGVRAG